MTFFADPEKVIYWLMKNSFVCQMGTFYAIRTPANLALAFSPHLYGTSQSPPAWRLQVTLIFALMFRLRVLFLDDCKLWGRGSDCYGGRCGTIQAIWRIDQRLSSSGINYYSHDLFCWCFLYDRGICAPKYQDVHHNPGESLHVSYGWSVPRFRPATKNPQSMPV
jgi:hypothetical protein